MKKSINEVKAEKVRKEVEKVDGLEVIINDLRDLEILNSEIEGLKFKFYFKLGEDKDGFLTTYKADKLVSKYDLKYIPKFDVDDPKKEGYGEEVNGAGRETSYFSGFIGIDPGGSTSRDRNKLVITFGLY